MAFSPDRRKVDNLGGVLDEAGLYNGYSEVLINEDIMRFIAGQHTLHAVESNVPKTQPKTIEK